MILEQDPFANASLVISRCRVHSESNFPKALSCLDPCAAREPTFADDRDYRAFGLRAPKRNLSIYLVKRLAIGDYLRWRNISEQLVIPQ